MEVTQTELSGVIVVQPRVFQDERGFFAETWNQSRWKEAGLPVDFVQDNLSFSVRGVLRGLHFQNPYPQGKLVYVLRGEVFDVVVDVRKGSPTFGEWVGCSLSADNHTQVFIPGGFAHGFCVTSDSALLAYKCTELYRRETEGSVRWNDPDIGIDWPIEKPTLSEKDAESPLLKDVDAERLPKLGE